MSDVVNGDHDAHEEDKIEDEEKKDGVKKEDREDNKEEEQEDKKEEEKPSVKIDRFTYTKEELLAISKLAYCKKRPEFLEKSSINKQGLRDLDIWVNHKHPSNHKNPSPSNITNSREYDSSAQSLINKTLRGPPKRDRICENEKEGAFKKRTDPRDRIKDESQDDIVLSPQRRSFGTGCHIVPLKNEQPPPPQPPPPPQQPQQLQYQSQRSTRGIGENHMHQPDRRDDQMMHRENGNRRIGSGRLLNQRDKGGADWSKVREFRDEESENRRSNIRYSSGRYDYDRRSSINNNSNNNSRYHHHGRRDSKSYEDEEPEWYTGGPTSQHDTIELKGFEEEATEETSNDKRGQHNDQQQQQPQLSPQPKQQQSQLNRPESREQGSMPNRSEDTSRLDYIDHSVNQDDQGGKGGQEISSKDSQEFDINEMFKSEGWKNMGGNLGNENATSIPGFGDSSLAAENQQSGGTSRFAQWFSASRQDRESPIDRLLQNVTFSSTFNASSHDPRRFSLQGDGSVAYMENGAQKINQPSVQNNEMTSGNRESSENSSNKGKELLSLLQKANININDLMQQQSSLPSIRFEQAKSVEEIEASLKSSSITGSKPDANSLLQEMSNQNSDWNRLILKVMSRRNDQMNSSIPNAEIIPPLIPKQVPPQNKPSNVMDLLKEEDLLAINQQMNCDPNNPASRGNAAATDPQQQQLPPWIQPKNVYRESSQKFFPNDIHDNNSFMSLMTQSDGAVNNRTNVTKGKAEDQAKKGESSNCITPPKVGTGNISAFTPTSVIRKFASEKDKEAIRKIVPIEDGGKTSNVASHGQPADVGLGQDLSNPMNPSRPILKNNNQKNTSTNLPPSSVPSGNPQQPWNQYPNMSEIKMMVKLMEHQRLQQHQAAVAAMAAQRHMNTSPMPMNMYPNPALRHPHNRPPMGNNVRHMPPVGQTNNNNSSTSNINVNIIRNMMHAATVPPVRPSPGLNPLPFPIIPGTGPLDPRQLQILPGPRGAHAINDLNNRRH